MYVMMADFFPLIGTGAKKGLSVSINKKSNGKFLIMFLKLFAFLKVTMPERDI